MDFLLWCSQDGYAVVSADGPGEYHVITESRAGNDAVDVTITPRTVAYVTTGGKLNVLQSPDLWLRSAQFLTCELWEISWWELRINLEQLALKQGNW